MRFAREGFAGEVGQHGGCAELAKEDLSGCDLVVAGFCRSTCVPGVRRLAPQCRMEGRNEMLWSVVAKTICLDVFGTFPASWFLVKSMFAFTGYFV